MRILEGDWALNLCVHTTCIVFVSTLQVVRNIHQPYVTTNDGTTMCPVQGVVGRVDTAVGKSDRRHPPAVAGWIV